MFTLVLERSSYVRLRRGVSAADVEKTFSCPVAGDLRAGSVVKITPYPLKPYCVGVGETYSSVASKAGIDAEKLKKINGGRALYPTVRIYLP